MAKRVTTNQLKAGDVVVLAGCDATVRSCAKMRKGVGTEWVWRLTLRTPTGIVTQYPYDLDEYTLRA